MSKLKPCPFCGAKPHINRTSNAFNNYTSGCYQFDFGVEFIISCSNPQCGIHFSAYSEFKVDNEGQLKTVTDGYKEIVDKWNARYEEKLPPLFREDIDDYD